MLKILVINDINDINKLQITHFSLDKGHYIAKSFSKIGHDVYFLTTNDNYEENGINYICIDNITDEFIQNINLILISREALFVQIITIVPAIKKIISIDKNSRNIKFIVKSDSPLWYHGKETRQGIHKLFDIGASTKSIHKWIISHVDFICAQNNDFAKIAIDNHIPNSSIILSDMGIPNREIDYDKLQNPYDINHSYCVKKTSHMENGKAYWPCYYLDNPNKIQDFNKKKSIIVYTGRIKVNGGKIFFNMRNILDKLGNDYELHIFPGSFYIPFGNETLNCSARNGIHLEILRDTIFKNSQNIIIHYPYEHEDKYRYLHFADCGIDFSDVRPKNIKACAGHAKILEYCEVGLPIVCEENINNINLIKNGKNGIILPYLASDDEYADAIKKIIHDAKIDRSYCRKVTVENENWDNKAQELLKQINWC